jgi:hypothetical protein
MEANSKVPECHISLAEIYKELNQEEEAIEHCRGVFRSDYVSPTILSNAGFILGEFE